MSQKSLLNTKEFEHEESGFSSAFEESFVDEQHYVRVVNPERVRGFSVEIKLEEGEHNAEGLNDDADENVADEPDRDSGYVPTTLPIRLIRDLTGNSRRRGLADEQIAPGPGDLEDPDEPDGVDSDDPNQRNIHELEGNLLFQHESRGHWPYDCGCDVTYACRHVVELLPGVVRREIVSRAVRVSSLLITPTSQDVIGDV